MYNDIKSVLDESSLRRIFQQLGVDLDDRDPDTSGWISGLHVPKPIHDDSNPSFSVNVHTGAINDFGGAISGDVITLVQGVLKCDTKHAMKWVENFIHEDILLDIDNNKMADLKLVSISEVEEWNSFLLRSTEKIAVSVRDYMASRSINLDTLSKNKIGVRKHGNEWWVFIPFKNDSINCTHWKQFAYDINKGGWKLNDGKKIVVTSGNAVLYPTHFIKAGKAIILVEGELDAIVAQQEGINAITQTAGANTFNNDMALELRRFTDSVFLCYDGDDAGRDGATKAARVLTLNGIKVKMVDMPDGEDTNSYISEEGTKAFIELIKLARDITPEESEKTFAQTFKVEKVLLYLDTKWGSMSERDRRSAIKLIQRILAREGLSIQRI
jgi:DNA primase